MPDVLSMLRSHKKGITFDNFRTVFRLGARIYDLRQKGYEIITKDDELPNGVIRARYILIKEPN